MDVYIGYGEEMIGIDKKERFCGKLRFSFRCVFLFVILLTSVPYIKWELEPFLKLFLIWGAVCVAADFYCGGRSLKDPSLWLLGLFCAAYAVSVFMNRNSHFSTNLGSLFYMGVVFLVCYGDSRGRTSNSCHNDGSAWNDRMACGVDEEGDAEVRGGILREFRTYLRIMSFGTFLLSCVCLATYILKINIMYLRGERRGYIGYWDDRLWGLYNANTNGFLCAISIFISVLFILWNHLRKHQMIWDHRRTKRGVSVMKRRYSLAFDIVNIIIQTLCLSLSYSRTSIMALAAGIMLIIWFVGDIGGSLLAAKPRRLFIVGLSGLAVVLLCLGLRGFLTAIYVKPNVNPSVVTLSANRGQVFAAEAGAAEAGAAVIGVEPEEIEEKRYDRWGRELRDGEEGMLTGRPMLWLAGFRTFLESPAFGVTRENLSQSVALKLSDRGWIPDLEAGVVHNGPLTVLISSGLAGFIPMLTFAVIYFCRIMQAVKPDGFEAARKKDMLKAVDARFAFVGAVALIVLMLITEMTESRLLYQVNVFFAFFWTICGYASVMSSMSRGS